MGQPAKYGLTHFRFRNDDDSETAATWVAAIDTGATLDVDTNYRCRFVVDNHGGTSGSPAFKFQYNLNSGGWSDIAAAAALEPALSSHFADEDATTQQVGSGTFNAGKMDETGSVGAITISNGQETEVEFCFQVEAIEVAHNDTIELRTVETDNTILDSYISPLPTITVNEPSATIVYPSPVSVTWSTVAGTLKEKITPLAVSVTWSIIAPDLKEVISPLSVTATWSVVAPNLTETITLSPISVTWSIVTPTLKETVKPTAVSSTWSVTTPTLIKTVKPSSISATWTISKLCVTAITQLAPYGLPMRRYGSFAGKTTGGQSVSPSPIVVTWSVTIPTVIETISPSSIVANWSVIVPGVKKTVKPSVISSTWSIATLNLNETIKPSSVTVNWSTVAVNLLETVKPSAVSVAWSIASPNLQKIIKPSPVSAAWSVITPIVAATAFPIAILKSGHYHIGA